MTRPIPWLADGRRGRLLRVACGLGLAGLATVAQAANFVIVNNDAANQGLNDPSAFTPEGGNNATTLGAARLNVFQAAGRVWGAKLKSGVDIVVSAKYSYTTDPANPEYLSCTATEGTLGGASPVLTRYNGYIYPDALASALTGSDVATGQPDIEAIFNPRVGQSGCLTNSSYYYGLDHKPPINAHGQREVDFLSVLSHEFGHGLGFASVVDESTGATADARSSTNPNGMNMFGIFDTQLYDEATGKSWNQDGSDAQRKAAAISGNGLTWSGANVRGSATYLTAGRNGAGRLLMYTPNPDQPGSSVSHWDTSATPNLLMEPYISNQPTLDLTPCAMQDIGWPLQVASCRDTTVANVAPVAASQSVGTGTNTAVTITLSASDANNDPLTYTVLTQPAHGSLTGTAPTLTYTPATGYAGADSFTFQASDGQAASNTATVTITVGAAATPQPAASSGGGGGAVAPALLLALAGLGMGRRRRHGRAS